MDLPYISEKKSEFGTNIGKKFWKKLDIIKKQVTEKIEANLKKKKAQEFVHFFQSEFLRIFSFHIMQQCDKNNIEYIKNQSFIHVLDKLKKVSFFQILEIFSEYDEEEELSNHIEDFLEKFSSLDEKNFFQYEQIFSSKEDILDWIMRSIPIFHKALEDNLSVYIGPVWEIIEKGTNTNGKPYSIIYNQKETWEEWEDEEYSNIQSIIDEISPGYYTFIPRGENDRLQPEILEQLSASIQEKQHHKWEYLESIYNTIELYIPRTYKGGKDIYNPELSTLKYLKPNELGTYTYIDEDFTSITGFFDVIRWNIQDQKMMILKKIDGKIKIFTMFKKDMQSVKMSLNIIPTLPTSEEEIHALLSGKKKGPLEIEQ